MADNTNYPTNLYIQSPAPFSNTAITDSNSELSVLINCDNLSPKELDAFVERAKEQMKRKEILSKHKPQIKQLPSGNYYTRIEGKKIQRKHLSDLEDVIINYYTGADITIETLFDKYIERRKMDVSATTWSKELLYYNKYISQTDLLTTPLVELDLDDGYNFLQDCLRIKPDMKKKYWNNLYGSLNQIFQYAIDKRIINDNPFRNMKPKKDLFAPPKVTRDCDTVFTKSEQIKVCEIAEADAIQKNNSSPLGIVLLFNLGLRDGELCAIKWGDIESNTRRVYIHIQRELITHIDDNGKTNGFEVVAHCKTQAGDRRLQLNDKALETFRQIKAINQSNGLPTGLDDYILLRWVNGIPAFCSPRGMDSRLRQYCKKSGMKVIKSPHDVRRTVLTNLYGAGMPLKSVQAFAGHSDLKQTMEYIRITDDDLDMTPYLNTLSDKNATNIIPFKQEVVLGI